MDGPDYKHCMILIIYMLSIFPFSNKVFSQKPDSSSAPGYSGKIQRMDHYLAFKFNINNDIEGFAVRSGNDYFDIQPNASLACKLSISYRFISFSIKYVPKFIPGNDDDKLKGKSRIRSYHIDINTNRFI